MELLTLQCHCEEPKATKQSLQPPHVWRRLLRFARNDASHDFETLVRTAQKSPMKDSAKLDASQYRFIGKPIPRNEDQRLVTGHGRFSADFKFDGETYAPMVRSPHPHARIR